MRDIAPSLIPKVGGKMSKQSGLATLNSPYYAGILVCIVAAFCYLSDMLGSALVLRPEMVWPLWPGCAFLVAVLLCTPRKIWPAVMAAGVGAFVLYDMQTDLTMRSIVWLNLSDIVKVLVAALGVSYTLGGIPRLNSIKRLALYLLFAVILAPIGGAFVAAVGLRGNYWAMLGISFLTEAFALLTVTPAILGWVNTALTSPRKSVGYKLEAALLIAGLVVLGYFTLVASGGASAVLLYSLVPFLLWSALRFGTTGIATSVLVVAFFSIWGSIHGRGPFNGSTALSNMLSLQLFLLFATIPFMVLAALVEERKLAEDKLREYERAVEGSEEMIAVVDREYHYLIANDKFLDMRKMTKEQVVGHLAREVLNEGVFDAVVKEKLDECFQGKVVRYETKYLYAELGERDVSVSYFPIEGASGVDRAACIMQDITDRKQVEEALAGISRRLIDAQEQERTRIARELHDDIGQRLSLLAVELDQLQKNSRDRPAQIRSSAGQLKQKAFEIVSDIHSLSHKLHSSKLQYLGITAAVRSFCREFGEQQNVEIDVNAHDLRNRLSPDIALCLFRVLQEALHNSAKHSGVRHFGVRLWSSSDEVHLAVSDSGAGFDVNSAMKGRGLGLTSMRERVRLVSGTIVIESKPTAGTTIHVCVPFKSEHSSARAAG